MLIYDVSMIKNANQININFKWSNKQREMDLMVFAFNSLPFHEWRNCYMHDVQLARFKACIDYVSWGMLDKKKSLYWNRQNLIHRVKSSSITNQTPLSFKMLTCFTPVLSVTRLSHSTKRQKTRNCQQFPMLIFTFQLIFNLTNQITPKAHTHTKKAEQR